MSKGNDISIESRIKALETEVIQMQALLKELIDNKMTERIEEGNGEESMAQYYHFLFRG
ncbi:MAG TPA: hypothetical protein VF487_15405 [Chitinophagaceae bacterium]